MDHVAAIFGREGADAWWTRPAAEIDGLIRGLSPFPGAWCEAGAERLKLLRSRLAEGQGEPGQILHGLTVACGDGAVEVLEVQRAGAKALPVADALRGWSPGRRLD